MSDDRLVRALKLALDEALQELIVGIARDEGDWCELEKPIRALFAEQWTDEEVRVWLIGAYEAGFLMGASGVPDDMRTTLAKQRAHDVLSARKKAKAVKP